MEKENKMKLAILGKYGPYPAADGGTSSYLIESGKTCVSLDFGSGALGKTLKVTGKLPEIIVLSHNHFDHTSDLFPLSYALKKPVRVYMPFDDSPVCDIISTLPIFEPVKISDGMTEKIGCLTFEFVRLPHPIESYGMEISDGKSSLFYSGDTVYDDIIAEKIRDCSLALLDASQPTESALDKPHMSVKEAKTLSDKTGTRVLLTHVHPEFSPEREAKHLGLELAEEMKVYEI